MSAELIENLVMHALGMRFIETLARHWNALGYGFGCTWKTITDAVVELGTEHT